jgi:two-component system, chemotaxis family, chemotaxis protein CheY
MNINHFILVDDDPLNNMLSQMAIEDALEFADIKLYEKPLLALREIEEEYATKPGKGEKTILFLDINMPLMTGWQFLDVYKGFSEFIRNQIIIFILSSSVYHRDLEQAKTNPMVAGFISKPLDGDEFKQMLAEFLGS